MFTKPPSSDSQIRARCRLPDPDAAIGVAERVECEQRDQQALRTRPAPARTPGPAEGGCTEVSAQAPRWQPTRGHSSVFAPVGGAGGIPSHGGRVSSTRRRRYLLYASPAARARATPSLRAPRPRPRQAGSARRSSRRGRPSRCRSSSLAVDQARSRNAFASRRASHGPRDEHTTRRAWHREADGPRGAHRSSWAWRPASARPPDARGSPRGEGARSGRRDRLSRCRTAAPRRCRRPRASRSCPAAS